MKIQTLGAQNYRAFKERTNIELRPLTLVFGENNAGKSSLVRLAPSIKASCTGGRFGAFSVVSPWAGETGVRDLVFGKSGGDKIQISIGFGNEKYRYTAAYEIVALSNQATSVVSSLTLSQDDRRLFGVEWEPTEKAIKDRTAADVYYLVRTAKRTDAETVKVQIRMDGLNPSIDSGSEIFSPQEAQALSALKSALDGISDSTYWIGPIRHVPERILRSGYADYNIGQTGVGAAQVLFQLEFAADEIFRKVSQWFKESLGHSLRIVRGAFAGDELFSLCLAPKDDLSSAIPFADAGAGMAQVLPIILLGELAIAGHLGSSPVLVIENPELHLHDAVHDDLGRFLASIVAAPSSSPTVIVETHSENLLLAVQLLVARGVLAPEQVIIHWVRKKSDGAAVDTIQLDELGGIVGPWPSTAFGTAGKQAGELFSLAVAKDRQAKR